MRSVKVAVVVLLVGVAELGNAQVRETRSEGPQTPQQVARAVTAPAPSAAASGVDSQNPFFGGVPSGKASPEVLELSLLEAIDRSVKNNLGLLLSEQGTRAARGKRLRALSDLLPNVTTHVSETLQQTNLAALGFSGFPGVRQIVGPFSVFDTRAFVSQAIFDLHAIHNTRSESASVRAAEFSYRDARDITVLVTADLYLRAIAGASRIEAARAQVKTAEALYRHATDLKKAGVAPGIDVLRAQVEWQARQQRLIFFENEFAKQKLSLARAIGLPIGQQFTLTEQARYDPMPPLTLEEALDRAYHSRPDYQGAMALVQAAELSRKAAQGKAFPSLRFDGNYGVTGQTPGRSHGSFAAVIDLKIPIFQGGKVRGEVLEADARIEERKAELENFRSRIEYEVRVAFLDIKAAGDQVQVAKSALQLANEQLKQAENRFAAGVVNNLEVVQAQEAVATADENYISSRYAFNIAKAMLARAMGEAEQAIRRYLGGKK